MHTVAAASAACMLDEPACMDRHAWTGMHTAAAAAASAAAACMRAGAAACSPKCAVTPRAGFRVK
jgi:hypothetical protein